MSMCDCNQGRLPCICKPTGGCSTMSEVKRYYAELAEENDYGGFVMASDFDRVTAERDALQKLLNAADQNVDDAATENNERELSRRSWFDEAQRLQAQLAYAVDALNEVAKASAMYERPFEIATLAIGELSASAEPSAREAEALAAEKALGIERLPAEPSAQVERDERAEFEAAYSGEYGTPLSVLRLLREGDVYIEKPQHSDRLNSSWWMWQARAALDCPDCGDTGVEPCSKHGWKP